MAKITVNGTVTAGKGGSFMILWEKVYLKSGREIKRRWKVWLPELLTFAEGSWVELEGEFSAMPAKMKDDQGSYTLYQTYEDKDGKEVTNWDLIINDPIILQTQLKDANIPAGVDMDDERKYGRGLSADDQPF